MLTGHVKSAAIEMEMKAIVVLSMQLRVLVGCDLELMRDGWEALILMNTWYQWGISTVWEKWQINSTKMELKWLCSSHRLPNPDLIYWSKYCDCATAFGLDLLYIVYSLVVSYRNNLSLHSSDPANTMTSAGTFTPTVTEDETFLHTYNCNWEKFPRKNDLSHRRKQMYRADYVKLHYVHYSTITVVSQLTEAETNSAGEIWTHRYKEPHAHEVDEETEATMLHTKSKVEHNTNGWDSRCKQSVSSIMEGHCSLGFPFPKDYDPNKTPARSDGRAYNCFMNEIIETRWWPKLVEAMERRGKITGR